MATTSNNRSSKFGLSSKLGLLFGGVLGVMIAFGTPSTAWAEALVIVEVATPDGEPANGTVELIPKSGEGPTVSCKTKDGKCEIDAVVGGMYQAKLVLSNGKKGPKPKSVMIPPSGRVTLHVSTK